MSEKTEQQAQGAATEKQNDKPHEKAKEKPLTPEMDAAISADVVRDEKKAVEQLRGQKKVRISIASGRSTSERAPVEVGVNGQHFLLERDTVMEVPEAVLNALNLAQESVPVHDATGRVANFIPTMRYPVTVHLSEAR